MGSWQSQGCHHALLPCSHSLRDADGLRAKLAIRFSLPRDTVVTVQDALLRCARILNIHVNRLFWDKGFSAIEVLEFLTQCGQPALIACPIRGKTGGTRALCCGNRSY